jgi:Polyketide cyclase / dehydrase and lipid transport
MRPGLFPPLPEAVMRIEREQHFDVPLGDAFEFITQLANWPAYWPGLVRIDAGSRWSEPGDEARIVIELLGREVTLTMTLRRLERNRLVEYESRQQGLPDARHERRFDAEGDGFRYRLAVEYEPRAGLRGLYDRFVVRRGVDRALRRTLANLDRELPRRPDRPL